MSNRKHLEALLGQFATAANLSGLALDQSNQLRLLFGDAVEIALDYDEPQQRVVLSANLGKPAAANREPLFRQMLEVNSYWKELGGLTLGFDGATDEALLLRPLFLGPLDYAAFEAALTGFVESAKTWMQLIGEEDEEEAAEMETAVSMLVHPNLRA